MLTATSIASRRSTPRFRSLWRERSRPAAIADRYWRQSKARLWTYNMLDQIVAEHSR